MNGDLQQNLHGAGSQLRKRKIEPIETIDLSISSSDEDVISHPIRSGNKIRKVGLNPVSEATNTISFGNNNNDDIKDISSDSSNNNILRDSKRSTQSTGMVETDTGFTRGVQQNEDNGTMPMDCSHNLQKSKVHESSENNLKLSSDSHPALLGEHVGFGRAVKPVDITNKQESQSLDVEIPKSSSSGLGLVKKNHDGHQTDNESDDSGSDSSDFQQFLRLDAGFSHSNRAESNTESIDVVDIMDSDNESDSSLEVLNAPYHGLNSPSPNTRERNQSSHMSGRQRRLEAARSKNLNGANKCIDTMSSDNAGLITNDGDESNSVTSGSDKEEDVDTKSKVIIQENLSDTMLSTNATKPTSSTPPSNFFESQKTNRFELSNDTISRNKSGSIVIEPIKAMEKKTGMVEKSNNVDRSEVMDVNQTINDEPVRVLDQKTIGKIFDNLYCNGKDFISWAKIDDPNEFLRRNDMSQLVNSWRESRNLPPLIDSVGFLSRLKRQVHDNMNSMGIEISSSCSDKDPATKPTMIKRKLHPSLTNLPLNGENFIQSLEITDPEDFLERKNLGRLVNPWRHQLNLPVVSDPNHYVFQWKKAIRDREGIQSSESFNGTNTNKREEDNSNCMTLVSALSKRFLSDETGLPVYQFGVYDKHTDGIIYEFRVEAKQSLIENAGNGAFLTFLGARECRPSLPYNNDNLSRVKSIQPLVAKDSDGFYMNLRVIGEHLQKQNRQYAPPTSLPPMHILCKNSIKDKYPWNIGSKGKSILTDYVENAQRPFSTYQSGCSTIDLGRYGPFRRSDRKVLVHYEIKNFIFSNEVSEWGFDLREDLRGEEQVADITDDTTGIPHHIARQNMSMYVNETGGDPELKQTVFSGQVLDREVNYYFKTARPMEKGETIELLISYLNTYDEIRERKGYGERNKIGAILGDDHFPTFLERNFVERYDMVEVIYEMKDVMDLYQLSEFLDGIRAKLTNIVRTFLEELQVSSESSEGVRVPFAQQIIAIRRLNWLKPYFVNKIESFTKSIEKSRKIGTNVSCLCLVLQQCSENTERLEFPSWPILLDLLDKHPDLIDKKGINLRSKVGEEVTEDICYGVSDSLLCPCHESVWCSVTATLIHKLCYLIARDSWDYRTVKPLTKLPEMLVQKAIEVSKAFTTIANLDVLAFDTDVCKKYGLKNCFGLSKQSRGTKCVMTLADDCNNPENKLPKPIILGKNTPMSSQTEITKMIHKQWYLSRQIILVVDIFAKKYLAKDDNVYSLETLCKRIGVASDLVNRFVNFDVKLDLTSSLFYGKDFKAIYSKGNKLRNIINRDITNRKMQKTGPKRSISMPVRKLLFWKVLIEGLKKLGWKIEIGSRPNDWYLLPPGVERGKGFKPRVDFFDSAVLVIKCLKTDKRFCNLPEIKNILLEYVECQMKYEKMKAARDKFIKNSPANEIVDFLKESLSGATHPVEKASPQQNHISMETETGGCLRIKDVVFNKSKLGLMLIKEGSKVVVKEVSNDEYKDRIHPGYILVSVGDENVRSSSLLNVVELLATSKRPLNVKFEHSVFR